MARIRSADQGVAVEGLRELNRALRAMGGREMQAMLKSSHRSVADFVTSAATGNAYAVGGVAAKVAPSIRASGTTTGAGVGFGGSGHPYAGGAEFGSVNYPQFKPWRGNGSSAGYFVYPSIRDNAARIEDEYKRDLDSLIKKVGLG